MLTEHARLSVALGSSTAEIARRVRPAVGVNSAAEHAGLDMRSLLRRPGDQRDQPEILDSWASPRDRLRASVREIVEVDAATPQFAGRLSAWADSVA
jgi:hypothetical protein